jgi:hypothetical protein
MIPEHWLSTATGVWWAAERSDSRAKTWPGLQALSHLRQTISLVPRGAPLVGSLSAVSHCRMLCRLCGADPGGSAIVTALRTVELADDRQFVGGSQLTSLERAATWLAVAQLKQTPILMLVDPEKGLSGSQSSKLARLVVEAAARHRQILIVGAGEEFAKGCGARPFTPLASDQS